MRSSSFFLIRDARLKIHVLRGHVPRLFLHLLRDAQLFYRLQKRGVLIRRHPDLPRPRAVLAAIAIENHVRPIRLVLLHQRPDLLFKFLKRRLLQHNPHRGIINNFPLHHLRHRAASAVPSLPDLVGRVVGFFGMSDFMYAGFAGGCPRRRLHHVRPATAHPKRQKANDEKFSRGHMSLVTHRNGSVNGIRLHVEQLIGVELAMQCAAAHSNFLCGGGAVAIAFL